MGIKVFFLLTLFGVAFSELPNMRRCEPEPRQDTPTLCSNYKNIVYLDKIQTTHGHKQTKLEERIKTVEDETRLHLESINSNISALSLLAPELSNAIKHLERLRLQTEKEFKHAKTQLENHKEDIDSLKREVRELVEHKETVSGNFSQIEEKLHTTESQLRDKKTKLENLEVETAAAFSETQKLLNVYKNELSYLNTTAQELEGKLEAQLDATKTELEANLKTIQNSSDALSAKLDEQNAEVREFKEQTESKFKTVDEQLKTQNTEVDKQKAAIDTLKGNNEGIKMKLESTEKRSVELNALKAEVNSLKKEVNEKVAFSASVTESNHVFTGPATTHSILIFNRIFSNIGNAYNSKTGIFTAPVKGVYHFSFMTFGYSSYTSGAILVKNGHYQVSTWEFKGFDASDTTSNTVILELDVKDTVNIILWRGGKVHSSVFSGFLVFPTS